MAKALDVAKFFINLAADSINEDLATNMRVNKLLYFAQAYSLKHLGYNLIEEPFEAWQYGPVVRDVYNTFQVNGKYGIDKVDFDTDILSREEQLYLLDIALMYDDVSTSKLMKISHVDGGPWETVYNSTSKKVIPLSLINEYYADNDEFVTQELNLDDLDIVGYRDSSGYYVIPKEYDEN